MEQQGEKLMKALTLSVDGLDNLDTLIPKLAALGKRHAKYKVSDGAFVSWGQTLRFE
jgi:hemoglobin-like flavoprotein